MDAQNISPAVFGMKKAAYSVNETLEIVPFGRTTLNKLARNGELRSAKLGKKTIFYAIDIAAFLAKLRDAA